MLSVLAEAGLVPPTVAATVPQLLRLTLAVISRADFLGSNQATSVVNPVTFKCGPERNAEHAFKKQNNKTKQNLPSFSKDTM